MLLRRMCKAIGAGGRLVIDGIWRSSAAGSLSPQDLPLDTSHCAAYLALHTRE